MTQIFNEKWIVSSETYFKEEVNQDTQEKNLYLISKIIPKNIPSRNKILYENKSISKNFIPGLIGKPLLHQHKNNDDVLPKGSWIESWEDDEFAYGKALVYNTEYNKDYIEYLQAAQRNKQPVYVSLQVSGEADTKESDDGNNYTECKISDVIEVSTVLTPGFLGAKASLEYFAESLNKEENKLFEKLNGERKVEKSLFEKLKEIGK
ncbi:MAG: hypothetical protein EOL97_14090 [Spirochaetia bacterium]|nr:hypothetical protein [Spirochaetia bacterium]